MKKIYFSLLLIFLTNRLYSQTCSFMIGGNFTSGNLLSYGINLRANLNSNDKKVNQIVFTPSFDYGVISNQNGDFQLRRRETLSVLNYERSNKKFKFYVYNEIENSFLRKIELRSSFGTGVSYKLISSESTNFDISQLILPEIFLSSFSNKKDNWAIRLSTRIRFSKKIGRYKYSLLFLFQPSAYTELSDGRTVNIKDNTNIRCNTSYEYVLSKNLSVGLTGDLIIQTYTSYINPQVKPYDTNFNLFIKGSF